MDELEDMIKAKENEAIEEEEVDKETTYIYPNTFPKRKKDKSFLCHEGEILPVDYAGDQNWMRSGGLRSKASRSGVLSDDHLAGPRPKKKKVRAKRQPTSPNGFSDIREVGAHSDSQSSSLSPVVPSTGDEVLPFVPLNDI